MFYFYDRLILFFALTQCEHKLGSKLRVIKLLIIFSSSPEDTKK